MHQRKIYKHIPLSSISTSPPPSSSKSLKKDHASHTSKPCWNLLRRKKNSHSLPIIQRFQKEIPNKTSIISKKPSVWKYSLTSAAFKFRLNCSKVITPPLMAQKWPQWLHECVRQFTQLKKKRNIDDISPVSKKNIIFGGSSLGVMRKSWIQKHLPNFFASHLRHRISETGSGFWANVAPEATANDNGKLFFHGCHTKWTIKRIWTTTKTKKMQFSTATCHVLKKKNPCRNQPWQKKTRLCFPNGPYWQGWHAPSKHGRFALHQ